jgi:putative oxidoreductase
MTTHNNNLVRTWVSWAPYLLSILRIVTAAMFILSGTMKLFAYPNGMPPDNSTAEMWSQAWVGGVLEFVGGLLMLVGLWTRPVAFILAGEMAVAYWQFHVTGNFMRHQVRSQRSIWV